MVDFLGYFLGVVYVVHFDDHLVGVLQVLEKVPELKDFCL